MTSSSQMVSWVLVIKLCLINQSALQVFVHHIVQGTGKGSLPHQWPHITEEMCCSRYLPPKLVTGCCHEKPWNFPEPEGDFGRLNKALTTRWGRPGLPGVGARAAPTSSRLLGSATCVRAAREFSTTGSLYMPGHGLGLICWVQCAASDCSAHEPVSQALLLLNFAMRHRLQFMALWLQDV